MWTISQTDSSVPRLSLEDLRCAFATSTPTNQVQISLAADGGKSQPLLTLSLPSFCDSFKESAIQNDHIVCTFEVSKSHHSALLSVDGGRTEEAPLSAAELSSHPPQSFNCAHCSSPLVSFSKEAAANMQYTPLPSEHWAELIEAWMCHAPATLTEDIAHQYGSQNFQPKNRQQMLIGQHYLIVHADNALEQSWQRSKDVSLCFSLRCLRLCLSTLCVTFLRQSQPTCTG